MSSSVPVKILIVEDDPIIAENLSQILSANDFMTGIAHEADDAILQLQAWKPDAALLDINLGSKASGIDIARWIKENHPIPFVFLTSYADKNTIELAKETRPGAYLLKPFTGPDVTVALEIALANFNDSELFRFETMDVHTINKRLEFSLSQREFEILVGLSEGLSNKGLSEKLFISENTIKTHLHSLFTKLNVKSRIGAIARIRQLLVP